MFLGVLTKSIRILILLLLQKHISYTAEQYFLKMREKVFGPHKEGRRLIKRDGGSIYFHVKTKLHLE